MRPAKWIWTVLFLLPLISSAQYELTFMIKGLPAGTAYLLSVRGNSLEAIDSCQVKDQCIRFSIQEDRPAGMYRMAFCDSLFTDVIFNRENIHITSESMLPDLSPEVSSSDENKVYFAYWRVAQRINDTVNLIASTGDAMYEASGHKMTPALDSMQRKAYALNKRLQLFADSLVRTHPALFAAKVIRAYQTPDYYAYLKSPGAFPYPTRLEFLRSRFFDHLDMSDQRLLNTEVVYMLLTDYLQTFGDPPSSATFIRATDTIMKVFAPYPDMQEYALTLLINSFEHTQWEKVFLHIIQNYIGSNSCGIDGSVYTEKAEIIMNLQPGKPAPDIRMMDIRGNEVALSGLNAKYTLVLFWGTDCEHCHQMMPGLVALYDKYHSKGFEIYAVAVDTDAGVWKARLGAEPRPWINVCDFGGVESETFIRYNTWFTPAFFLLGPDKTIIARPYLLSQIEALLKENLK
jgi:thiol-disulfide isomerase/thioredoxin